VKSASYLMHHSNFKLVRDLILQKSTTELQDDSGIPIEYFKEDKFDITLYGSFQRPIELFAEWPEPKLVAAYKEKKVKPLDFPIGYNYIAPNLLLARRK